MTCYIRNGSVFLVALALSACQSQGGGEGDADIKGASFRFSTKHQLKFFSVPDCALNDSPMPENVESATIDVVEVRLRGQNGKWYTSDFLDTPLPFDLGDLGCSIWENFSKFMPPPGVYDHLRLETVESGVVTHFDQSTFPLTVPSGDETGIKVFFNPPLVVSADQVTVCVLKYDRSNSIQLISDGEPNGYHFKPVVRAVCGDPVPVDSDDDEGSGESSSSESSEGGESSEGSSSSIGECTEPIDGSDVDGFQCLVDVDDPDSDVIVLDEPK